ncbi:MAG TPA: Hsp20/alpha crystallin family protein [Bryobacteraceae bacterium]|jgi:HSP20 family molecular chaperone IbpA
MSTYIINDGHAVLAALNDWHPHAEATNFRFPVGRGVTDEGLNLRVSMPGVYDEDFAFTIEDRSLILFGRRRPPAGFGQARKFALRYGNFEQRIAIPAGVDPSQIIARVHHGVLDIHIRFSKPLAASALLEQSCNDEMTYA